MLTIMIANIKKYYLKPLRTQTIKHNIVIMYTAMNFLDEQTNTLNKRRCIGGFITSNTNLLRVEEYLTFIRFLKHSQNIIFN